MAAYTNAQLNSIYSYLGFNFYTQFEPEVKSVILATQSTADGGDQPDATLQLQVLQIVSNLQNIIDTGLLNLATIDFVEQSSKGSTVNPARGDFLLRRQGRALIKQMCIIFGMKGVRQDYYSTTQLRDSSTGGLSFFPEDY